jgi:hypothetical protein
MVLGGIVWSGCLLELEWLSAGVESLPTGHGNPAYTGHSREKHTRLQGRGVSIGGRRGLSRPRSVASSAVEIEGSAGIVKQLCARILHLSLTLDLPSNDFPKSRPK